MKKIQMVTPLVEMDGDEMTRILWKMIKDELLEPFVELNTEYYDLGLPHRDETDDQITKAALIQKGASFAFPQNKMGGFSAFINALFQAFP